MVLFGEWANTMAQPKWVTLAGSLGVIPENLFFQLTLLAYDPAHPADPDAVFFSVIAGNLPAGVQCTDNGSISGIPQAIAAVQGVPVAVSRDVTSKFTVRAYTKNIVNDELVVDRLNDRTFTVTVTGQDAPKFVTPAGNIGTYYDGSPIDPIQIEITDADPDDNIVVSVIAGLLPPGLTISRLGLISGYIAPLVPIDLTGGFSRDDQGFDEYAFDFASNSASTNYQFTLEVTDGKQNDLRTYEIYVYSKDSMTADTTDVTADNTFVTADASPNRVPFLVNSLPSNLGSTRSDNFWAYQFIGLDFDQDTFHYLEYVSLGLELPPGTQLDPITGWLYGYLPDQGAVENTYNFAIFLRKVDYPDVFSDPYYFSLTLTGPVSTDVIWLTDADLGFIVNGSTSIFKVEAVNTGERLLQYQLKPGGYPLSNSGVYNKLPQGLQLLPSGEIAGRVSFNTFALDLGATTFDKTARVKIGQGQTTFDLQYTFTVNAYSVDQLVSVFKTFTITVDREYNEPYEELYVKCMPPQVDRDLIDTLIENNTVIPQSLVFRPDDPNFGIATSVIYNHCFGLKSSTYAEYVSSLYENHYWKNLILGEIKTAQALDDDGNVIYEVVYSKIQDNLVNNQGISVSKTVTLPYPVARDDSTEITTVYPNSLINMRDQVIDTIGQISNLLPRWMLSKQTDGKVLGFTPAWVIAYCNPGASGQVAYNIRSEFGTKLNLIDFEVDRYELGRLLSIHWDPVADSGLTGSWIPAPAETTFDLLYHYQLSEFVDVGYGYNIGDRMIVLGSSVGGQDGLNDISITVQEVGAGGSLSLVILENQAPLLSGGETFINISASNITGTGTGASFSFVVGSGNTTTVDQNSLRFEAPVDNYTNTEIYDKYLVFPQRNILA